MKIYILINMYIIFNFDVMNLNVLTFKCDIAAGITSIVIFIAEAIE